MSGKQHASHLPPSFLTQCPPRRSHQLRYVLRNKATGDVYLVVVFTMYLKEDVNQDGTLREGAAERIAEVAKRGEIG